MRILIFLTVLALATTACEKEEPYVCPDKTCFDFETYEEANAAYKSDSTCYAHLDGNKDGRACEILKD